MAASEFLKPGRRERRLLC